MDDIKEIESGVEVEQDVAMRAPGEVVVGLDIGTTKICCVVGEVFDDGVDIIGVGTAPSVGLKKVLWSISSPPSKTYGRP